MKRIKNYFLFILMLFLSALPLARNFFNFEKAFALSPQLSIEKVNPVNLNEANFTLTATLTNGGDYSGVDIEWICNGILINDAYKVTIPALEPDKSVLKMYKTEYDKVASQDVWVFEARIKTDNAIKALMPVTFKGTNNPLTINALTRPTLNYIQLLQSFEFEVLGLESETNVQWYVLDKTNKFLKAPGSSNQRTYLFEAFGAGIYTFIAKVGESFSDTFEVTIKYNPIESISFDVTQQETSSSGLNTYVFEIKNIDSTYDTGNINWYILGYTDPVQFGGTTYRFDPTAYGSYRIYASYNGEFKNSTAAVSSSYYTLEVKISRLKEILIGSAIVIGIIAVGLAITIAVKIKNEKVW